jgi:hypothetical protein
VDEVEYFEMRGSTPEGCTNCWFLLSPGILSWLEIFFFSFFFFGSNGVRSAGGREFNNPRLVDVEVEVEGGFCLGP